METSSLFKTICKIMKMKLIQQLRSEKRFFFESLNYWKKLRKFNASSHTTDDIEKMQYTLLRLVHTIEKGMSMRNPRKGFGQKKVMKIISSLNHYCDLYLDVDSLFLKYPLITIGKYIEYTQSKGVDIAHIENVYNRLRERCLLKIEDGCGGIQHVCAKDIIAAAKGNFRELLYSRHSIRYFEGEPSKAMFEEALEMAQRTPSACNRQGWKTHVYMGDESVKLLKWQGGCRGFEDEIKCAILVTANLKAFFDYEVHQAYIDGGLYAMNLINSLHFQGLGTIPLSVGFSCTKLKQLVLFGVPENEVPIVIIGTGKLPSDFNVAVSERKEINITNTFH